MALLQGFDTRTVIEDVRARQAAVLQLIYFTDTQATALLRIYALVGAAASSGSAASLFSTASVPRAAGFALAAAACAAVIGAWLCLRAMAPAQLGFPGREGSFWLFMMDREMGTEEALTKYLERAQEKLEQNYSVNERGSRALQHAKWFALAVPIAPLLVGTVTLVLKI